VKSVSVVGAGQLDPKSHLYQVAVKVGRLIASQGLVLICGGLFGVMEAACRGAKEKGGLTVGVLPGYSWDSNPFVDVKIPTGLGHGRNVVVAASSPLVIAVGGGYGTLSEISLALKLERRVISYKSWEVEGTENYENADSFLSAVNDAIRGL